MARKYYFRCKSNPDGPLLVLETSWEAREMAEHPDYERINELGEVMADEESDDPIPVSVANLGAAA